MLVTVDLRSCGVGNGNIDIMTVVIRLCRKGMFQQRMSVNQWSCTFQAVCVASQFSMLLKKLTVLFFVIFCYISLHLHYKSSEENQQEFLKHIHLYAIVGYTLIQSLWHKLTK